MQVLHFNVGVARYWARQLRDGKTDEHKLMRKFGRNNTFLVMLFNEGGVSNVKRQFPYWPDIRSAMYPCYRKHWDFELPDDPANTTVEDVRPVVEGIDQNRNLKIQIAGHHSSGSHKERKTQDVEDGHSSLESHGSTPCVGNDHRKVPEHDVIYCDS